jgi:hypothetical protein
VARRKVYPTAITELKYSSCTFTRDDIDPDIRVILWWVGDATFDQAKVDLESGQKLVGMFLVGRVECK